jgi:hypothetical protein
MAAKIVDETDIEVVETSNSETADSNTNTNKGSWVWTHFNRITNDDQSKSVVCQVYVKKKNTIYDKTLRQDPTGSTKAMIEHLRRLHGIYPPDQEKTNQLLLPNLLKRQRVEQRVRIQVIIWCFIS